jgi:thiol-disulfide isomerase/thioredoxin
MKKFILASMLAFVFQLADAQTDSTPVYKRFPVIPVFNISKLPDSTEFSKDDLQRKKATVIMLFSPDCSHCQIETKNMLGHIDLFKKAQIIMVSSMDFVNIRKFYEDYEIAKYENIVMGRDAAFLLGSFYGIKHYPSIFVYDKKGNFVKSFEGEFTIESVAEAL